MINVIQKDKYENFNMKKIKYDLFISCVSFEKRSIGFIYKMGRNLNINYCLTFINEDVVRDSRCFNENLKIFEDLVKDFKLNNNNIETKLENPSKIILEIERTLKGIKKNEGTEKEGYEILIDITAFPRGQLFTLLYYLFNSNIIKLVNIVYTSPIEYYPPLSYGYKNFLIPPYYEGPNSFKKPIALIIFTGLELDRALNLIQEIEPSFLILLNPFPGTIDIDDKSRDIIEKIRSTQEIGTKVFDITSNDPKKCMEDFNEILNIFQNFDFYVSVMGPKIEVFAVLLAYLKNPSFRIVYSIPMEYDTENYSKGCYEIYEFLFLK